MLGCDCRREHLKRRSNGAAMTRFKFHVGQQFEGGRDAEISGRRISDRGLRLAAHGFQIQLLQFLFEGSHRIPFRIRG